MTDRLEGKVAFITGAARGQGRRHAIRFAEEGADIIAVDILDQIESVHYPMGTPEDLEETVRSVEALGRRIVAQRADVRNFSELRAALDAGVAELGGLDIVLASAGIFSFGGMADLSEESWRDMVDVNLTGVWHTTKVATPHLIAGGRGGSIVITSSVGGLKGGLNVGHYITVKHGVVGMMRTLAMELGEHGIRVNTIHPTQARTPMALNRQVFEAFSPQIENPTIEDFEAASQGLHLLPVPLVEDVDISNAALFLSSDEGRYITGVALPVDAGALTR